MAGQNDRLLGLNSGPAYKLPCVAATTVAITLSGEQTVDVVACVTGDRVLVKNQANPIANGIYDVDTGAWRRSRDFDDNRDVVCGTTVFVISGGQGPSYWRVTTADPVLVGTSLIAWTQAIASDASMTSFTPAGAGAIARTAQAKLQEGSSTKDRGVVADGATDDSTKLSNSQVEALSYGRQRVFLNPGIHFAPNFSNYGDVHFVGPGKITGAFGLLGSPEDSGDGWITNDLYPPHHMRRFSTTVNPVVVLVGDSTATPYANALDYPATLSGMLERELRKRNPHKNITFYNRAIGGTSWADFNSGPDGAAPYTIPTQVAHWYTNANTDWLDYVNALTPDAIFIHFGMNDSKNFNPLAFITALAKIAIWTKVPDIIFCTTPQPQMNDPSGTFSLKVDQNGRDMAAGMHRTWARYNGNGLLDFNRASNILVRGLDPCQTYLEEIVTSASVTVNTVYEATQECRDYAFTAIFTSIPSDFWGDVPGGAVAPFKVRLSGHISPTPNTSQYNDLVIWRDAGGNLFYNVRMRREAVGTDTWLSAANFDTGVVAPTTGTVRINVEITESYIRCSLRDDFSTSFAETVFIQRSLPRFGGVFLPAFGFDGAVGDRPTSATLTLQVGREKRNIPILTSHDAWGTSVYPVANTEQPYGGNGVNHPTSIGARYIYGFVLERANLFGPGISVTNSAQGGAVGIGKFLPSAKFHVASAESGATTGGKTTQALEGLNACGFSYLTSNIGTIYPIIAADVANNEAAWLQYNHNIDSWEFYVGGGSTAGSVANLSKLKEQAYSASITIDSRVSHWYRITASNGTAFTIQAPSNVPSVAGKKIEIMIKNTSGGALGVITWDAVFKISAWISPANGFSRTIELGWDGTNWIETRTPTVDVPN